jgi:tetrahydromethanopterin S-methyltransferase subunit G|tara:strand:- start:921 stop:1109 length:189 start_codon:yes stop_codon:yes gene_type:complete
MSDPTPAVVADRVARLTDRVDALERQMDAVMALQRWQMGAAVGFGVVLTLLLPKISAALGLS